METTQLSRRAPRVLVANAQEWFARSIETILVPAGCTVIRAYTGSAAIELARRAAPDAIILDLDLPEIDGLTVCHVLRSHPRVTDSTPIVLTTAGPATRPQRLAALRAGACELQSGALDAEEFVLHLNTYLRAKFDADGAREENAVIDPVTGVYTAHGLERRAQELAAAAVRRRSVFACAAFAPDPATPPSRRAGTANGALARAFRELARSSDVVAQVGPAEFVVLAPETDAAGAARLAERLARAVERSVVAGATPVSPALLTPALRLRSAHYALAQPPEGSLDPLLPVARARAALRAFPAS